MGNYSAGSKRRLEFGWDEYTEIDLYCKSSWYRVVRVGLGNRKPEVLRQFNCKYNKVASAMLPYDDLLDEIASENKYTFISTGMSTIKQIDHAVDIFRRHNCPFELMHCVSTYPMDDEDANLNCINTLKTRYGCKVGYSGHESGLAISYAAAGLGISSLERHITLNRAMYGSDQAASLEPTGLRYVVGSVRKSKNRWEMD